MERYRIPKSRNRTEARVSNSRFIATVAPVFSVTEAHDLVREIRNEMPDATHHVYAFRIGYGNSVSEGMSDDGEPSGTAGPPAMAVLRGSDVGDVALVITRYFGGTKLGTGGLVSAYSAAAKEAFASLETIEKIDRMRVGFCVAYAQHRQIKRLIDAHDGLVDLEEFQGQVRLQVRVPVDLVDRFAQAVADATKGNSRPQRID